MNKAPKIYADWIKAFNVLKSGEDDEAILPLMQEGEIVWQSGVAERFLRKLVDTVNFRLNKAIDNFQKSRQSDENEIVQSLMQLRRELQFMLKVVDINVIPVKEKMELRNMIINQSTSIQESLEKSSESDRSGKLSSIIKNNKVIVQSLMQLRRELQFMLKVVDINAIPVKEKTELHNMIINQSNSIQESLEKSSESDRSGKLSSIIKNNKVTVQ